MYRNLNLLPNIHGFLTVVIKYINHMVTFTRIGIDGDFGIFLIATRSSLLTTNVTSFTSLVIAQTSVGFLP